MGRWSYSDKDCVEDSLKLPAKYIKDCVKHPNSSNTITWTWQRSGNTSKIDIIYKPELGAIKFDYIMTKSQEKLKYHASIIRQDCNYGNERYYFECPNKNCRSKVYTLYKAPSSKYFLCRKCQNLTYDEQKRHNKRMDGFLGLKYECKIEELMMTGKVKDRNKAKKLRFRQNKLMQSNYFKFQAFVEHQNKILDKISRV